MQCVMQSNENEYIVKASQALVAVALVVAGLIPGDLKYKDYPCWLNKQEKLMRNAL